MRTRWIPSSAVAACALAACALTQACAGDRVGEGTAGAGGVGATDAGVSGAGAGGADAGVGGSAGVSEQACLGVCQWIESCGGLEVVDCLPRCLGENWSQACVDALESAPCSEVLKTRGENPSWLDVCYPPCDGGASCEGDMQRRCRNGHEYLEDCTWVCAPSWTGYCGVSFEGGVTSDGLPACWCN